MDATLSCKCGAVEGRASRVSARSVNRVVCYCDDCQAFVHHLGRSDLLDRHGGSDIVQMAPASLTFHRGQDRIAGIRLSPKGLYRWYATCCNTPLGNTVGPAIPLVGVVAQGFAIDGQNPDSIFGRPVGAVQTKHALGHGVPGAAGFSVSLIVRMLRKMLAWRLTGRSWPNPFFARESRTPLYPVSVLTRDERNALRPLCGPQPEKPAP